ncbi:MAG: hypothetical protein HY722_05790 [Planctomycetes bacterium]|nr:hypothetical protein [Planctomycetota bacterium]
MDSDGFDFWRPVIVLMLVATLACGGWAAYAGMVTLDQVQREVVTQRARLEATRKAAEDPELKSLLERLKEAEALEASTQEGLFSYVQVKARDHGLIPDLNAERPRFDSKTGYDKETVRANLRGLGLKELVAFLHTLQTGWPEVKLETLNLGKRDEKTQKWGQILVEVAVYRSPEK